MNHRSFFKKAATGAAVLAAAPSILSEPFMPIVEDWTPFPAQVLADPHDLIGQWVSYKYHFTVSLPPDRSQRIRFIE